MYEGCVSHLVVVQYLAMPHVWHVYMLQPFVRPHIRHVYVLLPFIKPYIRHEYLGLHKADSLKDRTTCIWSFGCGFACAIMIGGAGFRL